MSGRGGDRWVAGGGSPHTVLINGLGPGLSSWSAGHLLHSHLGGGSREDCQPWQPSALLLGYTAPRDTQAVSAPASKRGHGGNPRGRRATPGTAGPHTQGPGLWSGPFHTITAALRFQVRQRTWRCLASEVWVLENTPPLSPPQSPPRVETPGLVCYPLA